MQPHTSSLLMLFLSFLFISNGWANKLGVNTSFSPVIDLGEIIDLGQAAYAFEDQCSVEAKTNYWGLMTTSQEKLQVCRLDKVIAIKQALVSLRARDIKFWQESNPSQDGEVFLTTRQAIFVRAQTELDRLKVVKSNLQSKKRSQKSNAIKLYSSLIKDDIAQDLQDEIQRLH
jgi:hypothetical protein